jgi:hypothetical protein
VHAQKVSNTQIAVIGASTGNRQSAPTIRRTYGVRTRDGKPAGSVRVCQLLGVRHDH